MKVENLSIGNIYKNSKGERIMYVGIFRKGFYRDQHDFNSIDKDYGGLICTDDEIESCVFKI